MKALITKILINLLLRSHGWKRHTLDDGTAGWRKQLTLSKKGPHPFYAVGPTSYAIRNFNI